MVDFGVFLTYTLSFLGQFISWFFGTIIGELYLSFVIITFFLTLLVFIITSVKDY